MIQTRLFLFTIRSIVLCSLIFQGNLSASTDKTGSSSQTKGFIRNVGQFDQSSSISNTQILFKLPGQGMDIYITNGGLSYMFREKIDQGQENREEHILGEYKWSRVNLGLENARISKENMICEERLPARITYYRNNSAVFQTEINKKIRFVEVYPGIDWVIYMKGKEVKYDFELKAGADPAAIKMRYTGDALISGKEKNSLIEIKNSLGELREGGLFCYNAQGKQIECAYSISRNLVSIVPSGYNRNEPLVIDPPLAWSTYAGGTGDELATTIAHDASGNIIIGGYTNSTDFPVSSSGAFQGVLAGNNDAFLSKFSNTGELLWSTYIGGSSPDNIFDVQVNTSGDILLIGSTSSNDFPVDAGTEGGYFQQTFGGNTDAFVAKFSSSGSRLWATYYGGSDTDSGNSIAIDPQGNIYFTGASWSPGFPLQNPGGNAYYDGSIASSFSDAYLVKLSPTGSRIWATLYGGNNGDAGICLTTDMQGNVFVAGNTWSTDFHTMDAGSGTYYQPTLAGGLDVFVLKFAPDASLQWATYYGGVSGDSRASSIACDSRGKVYVAGRTGSASFPVTDLGNGAYFHAGLGGNMWTTPYVMRFDNMGRTEWSTYLDGNGTGWTYDVEIAANDHVFITGETRAPDFVSLNPGNGSYYQPVNQGSMKYDAFITEFDPNAVVKWSTFLGGSADDYGQSLTIDSYNNLFVTGYSKSTDFPVVDAGGNGYFTNTLVGGIQDVYVTKFGSNTLVLPDASFTEVIACSGDTTHFTDLSSGNITGWAWNFGEPASAQLNTSSLQNPTHVFLSGGTYSVKLKVSNVFGTDSLVRSVQVVATVQGTIIGLDTVYCNNYPSVTMTGSPSGGTFSGNGVSGNIFLPKEAQPGMNLIVYTPPAGVCTKPAKVWVRVKNDESCDGNSIESDFLSGSIQIFPNPFQKNIQIQLLRPELSGQASLSVKGIRGEEIWNRNVMLQVGANPIELPDLAPGVYFLQVMMNQEQLTIPLIKISE